jgi:hypothetical protein
MDIQRLQKRLREFTAARDWEQFHACPRVDEDMIVGGWSILRVIGLERHPC